MKIKEIEERSGMTRANIRFYESLELLNPTRDANGYRDYSEDDLEILRKIKLLRLLEMPLEEIKALHNGKHHLLSVLEQHIQVLEQKKVDLEKSKNVCEYMRNDQVSYQTLNAQYYLNKFTESEIKNTKPLSEDTLPIVYSPWRRYFARFLDLSLYATIWFIFAELVLDINMLSNFVGKAFFSWFIEMFLLLFLEPLFLSCSGTTPGKWLLGLSLTTQNDRRLTYSEAFTRTWRMFIYGLGLNLPLISLYRLWRSYHSCSEKQTLIWEDSYVLIQKKDKIWKLILYLVSYILFYGCRLLSVGISTMPEHRGDITVQEFCDNFNTLAERYQAFDGYQLQEDGTWLEPEYAIGSISSIVTTKPNFEFSTDENGILKNVFINEEYIPNDNPDSISSGVAFLPSYETAIKLSMFAFVKAQDESTIFQNEVDALIQSLDKRAMNGWDDFHTNIYGISLGYDITKIGYTYSNGMFVKPEKVTEPFSLSFSMTKIDAPN